MTLNDAGGRKHESQNGRPVSDQGASVLLVKRNLQKFSSDFDFRWLYGEDPMIENLVLLSIFTMPLIVERITRPERGVMMKRFLVT